MSIVISELNLHSILQSCIFLKRYTIFTPAFAQGAMLIYLFTLIIMTWFKMNTMQCFKNDRHQRCLQKINLLWLLSFLKMRLAEAFVSAEWRTCCIRLGEENCYFSSDAKEREKRRESLSFLWFCSKSPLTG